MAFEFSPCSVLSCFGSCLSCPVLSLSVLDSLCDSRTDWVSEARGHLGQLAPGFPWSAAAPAVGGVGFLLRDDHSSRPLIAGVVTDEVGVAVLAPPADGQQLGDGLRMLGEPAQIILRDPAVQQL